MSSAYVLAGRDPKCGCIVRAVLIDADDSIVSAWSERSGARWKGPACGCRNAGRTGPCPTATTARAPGPGVERCTSSATGPSPLRRMEARAHERPTDRQAPERTRRPSRRWTPGTPSRPADRPASTAKAAAATSPSSSPSPTSAVTTPCRVQCAVDEPPDRRVAMSAQMIHHTPVFAASELEAGQRIEGLRRRRVELQTEQRQALSRGCP